MKLRSSETDSKRGLLAKMEEYRDNGAALGWLIDPIEQQVHVYRAGVEPESHPRPATIGAYPELSGFQFDLAPIWD